MHWKKWEPALTLPKYPTLVREKKGGEGKRKNPLIMCPGTPLYSSEEKKKGRKGGCHFTLKFSLERGGEGKGFRMMIGREDADDSLRYSNRIDWKEKA